jgi:uncharacterized protein (TIGR03000 family)
MLRCLPLCVILTLGFLATFVAAADGPVPADRVTLVVRLPATAKLTIESADTAQTGAERTFESPSLPAGQHFVYTLVAIWSEGGQEQKLTRQVFVRAGERTVVDLRAPAPEKKDAAPKTRSFLFTYRTTVTDLPAGKVARIWVPVPHAGADQDVQIVSKQLPADEQLGREPKFGNQILYVEAKAGADGKIALEVTYRVTRREVKANLQAGNKEPEQLAMYLEPDAKVPIGGKPLDLIKDKVLPKDQVAAAHVLYDVVNNHMRYSKQGTGCGQGDAVCACESGYGNCSDFHSLFISLARSQKIPAKFEIGFPLPPQRGAGEIPGYHCWAKFHPHDNGWVPVDISEANKNPKLKDYYFGNLTEDRLTFSTGRDLDLVPKQDGPPLNFFVYPYVEVDGKPYAADKVLKTFSYKDVAAGQQQ